MDPYADIDLDSESVWLDGAWYTRDELAKRIRSMIESGDFRVSRPSQALERLEVALGQVRVLEVRMPLELAEGLSATALRLGQPVGHFVREALAYYLSAAAAYESGEARAPTEAGPGEAKSADLPTENAPPVRTKTT